MGSALRGRLATVLLHHVGGHDRLLDEIALANRFELAVMTERFQVWDLIVSDDCSASMVCGDGDQAEIYSKHI